MSPAKMLAKRRIVSESTRARWLTSSIGSIKAASRMRAISGMPSIGGPKKCSRYFGPACLNPWV